MHPSRNPSMPTQASKSRPRSAVSATIIKCMVCGAFLIYILRQLPPLETGWVWHPHLTSITYSIDDSEPQNISLVSGGTPLIAFTPDSRLTLHKLTYQL